MMRPILILMLCCCSWSVLAQDLSVATYNIRCENRTDDANGNGWKRRCPHVVALIRNYDFDLFGAQEVTKNQLDDLQNQLPAYGRVGVARDDGKDKGEFSPIFYQKAKFNVLQSGTFWLAPNDSLPTIGWDAALPRICTWARLQPINGTRFWFFNLHMDHIGKVARLESAKLVLRKITEMCGSEPVILCGDFNMDQQSAGYQALSQTLIDAFEGATLKNATKPTFNDYDINKTGDSRIDHLFVTNHFKINQFDVLTDTYQADTVRLPSDHYPVRALLKLN